MFNGSIIASIGALLLENKGWQTRCIAACCCAVQCSHVCGLCVTSFSLLLVWLFVSCLLIAVQACYGLSLWGYATDNAFSWTRTGTSVGCGCHHPTSCCACSLNFCMMLGYLQEN